MAQQNQWVDITEPTSTRSGRASGPGGQKPVTTTNNEWEDITEPIEISESRQPGAAGYINRAWDWTFGKGILPEIEEKATQASNWITDPSRRLDEQGNVRPLHPLAGFGAGVLEGVGGVANLAPGDLAALGLEGAAFGAAKLGLPTATKWLTRGARAVEAPVAVHGVERITDPDATPMERLVGVAEAAGGSAGVLQPNPRVRGTTPPTPPRTPEVEITDELVEQALAKIAAEEAPVVEPTGLRRDIDDMLQEITGQRPPPEIVDDSIEASVKRYQEADRMMGDFDTTRVANTLPREEPQFSRDIPSERQDPNLEINQMLKELGVKGDTRLEVMDPSQSRVNASGESAASMEAMSRQRGMQDRGEQFVVYDRAGNRRPLIGPDAVDYRVQPGETYGVETPQGFRMLDDAGGKPPEIWEDVNPKADIFSSEIQASRDKQWNIKDALSTAEMDDPIAVAKAEAKHLGLNLDDYTDLGDLQWAITRRVAQETKATGRNPLTDPNYKPSGEIYKHDKLPEASLSERPVNVRTLDELEDRVALLESRPNLNAGGKRALEEMRDEIARRKSGESPEPGFDKPDFGERVTPFPKGGKRQLDDIAEQIRTNLDDTDLVDDLVQKGESILMRETDPEVIKDNFRVLDEYLNYAKRDKNPDEVEMLGQLRDMALHKMKGGDIQQSKITKKAGLTANDPGKLGKILGTSLYSGNVARVAPKELLQNSLDAIRPMGEAGEITIHTNMGKNTVAISDNGIGMGPEDVETILLDLGGSGKGTDESAIGGFGLAKASFLLGGESVKVRTVGRGRDGKLYQTEFEATPQQILDKDIDLSIEEVPGGTPTGMDTEIKLPDNAYAFDSQEVIGSISEYSDIQGTIYSSDRSPFYKGFGKNLKTALKQALDPNAPIDSGKSPHKKYEKGETVATLSNESGDVELIIPKQAKIGTHKEMSIIIRNKGMYQGTEIKWFGKKVDGIPNKVIVDIDAKVPEGHPDYPFTANREHLRGSVGEEVSKYINENIILPSQRKKSAQIQEIYDKMPSLILPNGRQLFFYDVGSKFKAKELSAIAENPVTQSLGTQASEIIDEVVKELSELGYDWGELIERTGIILDEAVRGLHVPNPQTGKHAVMVNPFQLMARSVDSPDKAAAGFVHTMLHEIAHSNPRSGGHDEDFTIALANIYEAFGAGRTVNAQNKFLAAVTGPDGGYTPEVSKLLREYNEIRGRDVVKEDILSGTGVESKASRGPKEGILGDSGQGGGDFTQSSDPNAIYIKRPDPEVAKYWMSRGYAFDSIREVDGAVKYVKKGGPRTDLPILEAETHRPTARPTPSNADRMRAGQPPRVPPRGGSGASGGSGPSKGPKAPVKGNRWVVEAFNLPRAIMASYDFSAPLRQGLPLAHRKEFWSSLSDMFRSWKGDDVYRAIQDDILARPLFKSRTTARGKPLKSFAEEAGLKFTDLDSLSGREERIMSTWAEKIPGFGRGIRASNRAYTTFLNKLRADTFEALIKEAKIFGLNGEVNLPLAREIADYVNTSSGRGHLGNLEKSAVALNTMFFSPRLLQSRLKMLNPMYYVRADPFVRKQALKSLFAVAGIGNILGQLGKMAGAEVETNPNNSDFGKIKIGNTRLDPYGGFQQFVVAANRLMRPGMVKIPGMENVNTGIVPIDMAAGTLGAGGSQIESSSTGKNYDLWNPKGPYDPTHASVAGRFFRSKLHPTLGFAYALLSGGKEMTGEEMKFGLDPSKPIQSTMDNAIAQRFIPIVLQDLHELAQEDPKLAALLGIPVVMGMSSQTYGRPGER